MEQFEFIFALTIVATFVSLLTYISTQKWFEARCERLEFRVETLEEEVEILEDYIERNEEKWKN